MATDYPVHEARQNKGVKSHVVQPCPQTEAAELPKFIRTHIQNLDKETREVHGKSNTSQAGAKHLAKTLIEQNLHFSIVIHVEI